MFAPFPILRNRLQQMIDNQEAQGCQTTGLQAELAALPDSYDALYQFARKLEQLPQRPDWTYIEPSDWEGIQAELAPGRPQGKISAIDPGEAQARAETAFLSSVCGCILGKPLEINPTLAEIRTGLEEIGEWPLSDYISERLNMRGTHHFHRSWPETVRERISYAAPDDDINYTVLGMLTLEKYGLDFTKENLRMQWMLNIPLYFAFGPERTFLINTGAGTFGSEWEAKSDAWFEHYASFYNPGNELCGAMIRADAYGYACPGDPGRAASLAWKDASLTHRRTGIYGTMFAAAAMAVAPVCPEPLEVFRTALQFVPQRSRFFEFASDCFQHVARASDWMDGYQRIHASYPAYAHCRIYQETGTLINSLRFAKNIGDGICLQVMQGNDTDSYGATCGSLLGLFFGPGHLAERWLRPFNDTIHVALAQCYETSLSRLAARMARLPLLTLQ